MESISGNPAGISQNQQVSNQSQVNANNPQTTAKANASNADTVTISQQAQDLLAAESNQATPPPETAALHSGTDNGTKPR